MSLSPSTVPGSPTTYGWSITSAGGSGSPGFEQAELAAAAPGVAGEIGDRLVDGPEAGEVVVDEEPEHPVVGAGQLADPHRERHRLQLALGGVPFGLAGGIAEVDVVGRAQLEPELGADDGDRAADEPGDVLAAEARRTCRSSTAWCRSPAAAPTAPTRRRPDARRGGRRRRRRARRRTSRAAAGPASGRGAARRRADPRGRGRSPRPRRRRPARGAARRAGCRRRRTPRGSRRGGRGARNPATGLTCERRVDLVDAGLDPLHAAVRRRVDEAELPAGGPGEAGRHGRARRRRRRPRPSR